MRKSKIIAVMFTGFIVFSSIFSLTTFAGDDNIGFEFKIPSWNGNARVSDGEARYRETVNADNQWKVGLRSSGEGEGTITDFWLENYAESNVSPTRAAEQGSTNYYTVAYDSASRTTVYLTAENNNWNSATYNVSGIWDEETAVYP